jgi:hypothetical protein
MLRWVDGFEHYGAIAHLTEGVGGGAAWSEVVTNPGTDWSLSSANPATGDYHMRLTDGSGVTTTLRRIWGVAKQVVGAGYRFAVADLPSVEGAGVDDPALVLAAVRDVANAEHLRLS